LFGAVAAWRTGELVQGVKVLGQAVTLY